MVHVIQRILVNALALYAAYWLVPGVHIQAGIPEYLMAGLALGLLNLTVRPVLRLISFPLIIITFGLFSIVINAIVLWILDGLFGFITIESLIALLLATLVVSVVNVFATHHHQ